MAPAPTLARNDSARPLAPSSANAMSVDAASGSESAESSADEHDDDDEAVWPDIPPPGCLDPDNLPKNVLTETSVLEGRTLVPLLVSLL